MSATESAARVIATARQYEQTALDLLAQAESANTTAVHLFSALAVAPDHLLGELADLAHDALSFSQDVSDHYYRARVEHELAVAATEYSWSKS